MKIEIKAPAFPESVADGEVSLWHKQEGDFVQRDELLVEIETDKVVMEVVAPEAGRLDRILVDVGNTIESEALLAELTPGEATESLEASSTSATVKKAEVVWLIWLNKPPRPHPSLHRNPRRRQHLRPVPIYKGPRVSALSGVFQ